MRLLLTALFSISLFFGASAQIVDRSKERAKDKTNNRIDNKIDNGIDKGLDSIEGLFKKKKKDSDEAEEAEETKEMENTIEDRGNDAGSSAPSMNFGGMFVKKEDVPKSYTFDHAVDYHMTNTDKKGKKEEEMDMTMLLSDDDPQFGMSVKSEEAMSHVVYDIDDQIMVTLTESKGEKTGMAMKLDQAAVEEAAVEEATEYDGTFRKTGRTKVILGYTCEEWVGEDDGVKTEAWISNDAGISLYKAMSVLGSDKKGGDLFGSGDYPAGLLMESTTTDKNGDVSHMIATKVAPNSKPSLSTSDYTFFSF